MAQKLYDLCACTSVSNQNGQQKKHFARVGVVMQNQDGSQFVLLDRHFSPAGVMVEPGKDRILLSCFEPRQDNQQQQQPQGGYQQQQQPQGGYQQQPQGGYQQRR